jgi:hypothetical protein
MIAVMRAASLALPRALLGFLPSLLSVATFGALSSYAAPARAEDPSWFIPEGKRPRTLALEVNPLAFLIGRYSFQIEYVFAPHHAFELSPHVYYAVPGRDDEVDGLGTEMGYRYYTGRSGPEGWFVGGSIAFGSYRYKHVAAPYVTADHRLLDLYQDTSYASLGASIDAGYQVLLYDHFAIGAGLGLAYNGFTAQPRYETISHARQDFLYGSGFRPRVLLETGGAF